MSHSPDQQWKTGDAERSAEIAAVIARGGHAHCLQGIDNPDITWGRGASEGVWLPTRDGHKLHLAFDAACADAQTLRPGVRVFTGVAPDTDIVALTAADGIALLTVLHSPAAPSRLRYWVSLPSDLVLEAMPSGGLDVVHRHFGATVARMNRPWATDSTYRPLAAEYIDESTPITIVVRSAAEVLYPLAVGVIYRYSL